MTWIDVFASSGSSRRRREDETMHGLRSRWRTRGGSLVVGVLLLFGSGSVWAWGTEPGDIAAHVTGLRGEVDVNVEVRDAESGTPHREWQPATDGMALRLSDRVQTGEGARAVIQFADRNEEANAGPSIFNIGPSSEVVLDSFEVNFDNYPPRVRGAVELVRGVIDGVVANFIKGWGQTSYFSVRAGVAVCGIRGTEFTLEYVPEGERLRVTVRKDEVVVTGPAGSRTVHEGETILFLRGVAQGGPAV